MIYPVLIRRSILAFCCYFFTCLLYAEQAAPNSPVYFIFDASNSMWGELPDKSRKIESAKQVFKRLDANLFSGREVALRVYGHRRVKDCSDTELVIPFTNSKKSKQKFSQVIKNVTPRGKTPISRSLSAALNDFGDRKGEIILISDGIETCDVDPCELIESWNENDVQIRVHVIGLGLTEQAKTAMQCISEASGTQYRDASNIVGLSEAIVQVVETPPPEPTMPALAEQKTGPEFKIIGVDGTGSFLPVAGVLSQQGIETENIESNHRYTFAGGEYSITVGVPTVNSEIYRPVTKTIKIQEYGRTRLTVVLERPPMIRTKFMQGETEIHGSIAAGFVGGKEIFKLRPGEDYYISPGDYVFKANVDKDNTDLAVSEHIFAGDDKDIVFNLVKTVHTKFKVYDKKTGKTLRQHQELWQDGVRKYKIHYSNGAKVQPGKYKLLSHSFLTPYTIEEVEVPNKNKQTIEIPLEHGRAELYYKFHTEPKSKDRRCWLNRVDDTGKISRDRSKGQRCNGKPITLSEGKYSVLTYSYLGEFEQTVFDVKNSETTVVYIEQK